MELGSPGCDVVLPLLRGGAGGCVSPEKWSGGQTLRVLRFWEGRDPGHSGLHLFGVEAAES